MYKRITSRRTCSCSRVLGGQRSVGYNTGQRKPKQSRRSTSSRRRGSGVEYEWARDEAGKKYQKEKNPRVWREHRAEKRRSGVSSSVSQCDRTRDAACCVDLLQIACTWNRRTQALSRHGIAAVRCSILGLGDTHCRTYSSTCRGLECCLRL
jgi:hypothetical protein